MKQILVIIFSLFISFFAYGQNQSVLTLQKTIDKIHSLKSLSYDYSSVQKNPFSTGDTSQTNMESVLEFDRKGLLKRTRDKTEINKGESQFESFFRNDTLYQVDLMDSTYTLYPKPVQASISMGMMPVIELIRNAIEKNPEKIFQRNDTVVNGIDCRNFLIKTYDSVVNGQHNFTNDYIAIDKATNLPVFYKNKGEGIAEKEGHVIGRLTFFNEDHFFNLKIDKAIDPSVFDVDLTPFSLPNKKMLTEGSTAPALKLKNLQSKEVPLVEFKNKLMLIAFGATDCGANPLANPMLNRLYKKYASSNFSVVSIYATEPADKVKKYVVANSFEFPVYIGSLQTRKVFKTVGSLNFYLVDKSGKILKSADGYSDDLEKELNGKIDEMLRK